jgi:hypothetical protein
VICHLVALQVGIRRNNPRHRWPWQILTLSPVLILVAVLSDTFNRELTQKHAFPTSADFIFLVALLPAVVFIIAANHSTNSRSDRAALLDASMVAIAAAFLAWVFLVAPHFDSDAFSAAGKVALFSLAGCAHRSRPWRTLTGVLVGFGREQHSHHR